MDILSSTAQQLTDQAQRLSAITGLTKSRPCDRFFLLMGKTGFGKEWLCCKMYGAGCHSWRWIIFFYTLPGQNRRIHLIDIPGFNDTNRSDIETLSILASYLGASYANGVSIHRILILHPITDNRMSGSSMRNVEMMKKMCGEPRIRTWLLRRRCGRLAIHIHILGRPFVWGQSRYPEKLSEVEKEKEALRKSMGDLHEQEEKAWKEKIQLLDKRFREQIARREGELEELEESIHEIHEEAMFSNFSLQGEKEYEEH
ncbi:hypothetical protein CNMCM5878_008804 [Aspergillus fumigatiaffinis]|nr:hypothetical protein CNMCM5878_008804 [Aspergillus fumigatiaffinis]